MNIYLLKNTYQKTHKPSRTEDSLLSSNLFRQTDKKCLMSNATATYNTGNTFSFSGTDIRDPTDFWTNIPTIGKAQLLPVSTSYRKAPTCSRIKVC